MSARQDRGTGRWLRGSGAGRLALAALAASGLVLAARQADLGATVAVLGQLAPLPFATALALTLAGVVNRAGQFRSAHRVAGLDTDLRSMTRVSAAGYALNKVIKTGGLGGVALFVRHGHRRGLPAGEVLAACLVSSLSAQFAMLAVTGVALGSVVVAGGGGDSWTAVGAAGALGLMIGLAATGVAVLRSRSLAHRWYPRPFALARRLAERVGRRGPTSPDPAHIDRFFDVVEAIRRNPLTSLPVLAHALAAKAIGAAVLFAALAAVGADVSPGTALVVYAVALVAAAGTVLPGGLGAVEATMTVLLARSGVPTSTALAGTLTFRLLDLWLPIVFGLLVAPGLDRNPIGARRGRPVLAAGDAAPLAVPQPWPVPASAPT